MPLIKFFVKQIFNIFIHFGFLIIFLGKMTFLHSLAPKPFFCEKTYSLLEQESLFKVIDHKGDKDSNGLDQKTVLIHETEELVDETMYSIFKKYVEKNSQEKKGLAFILPTGSSPLGLYEMLREAYSLGKIDFSGIGWIVNMDEYKIPNPEIKSQEDLYAYPESYFFFMQKELIGFIEKGITHMKVYHWFDQLREMGCVIEGFPAEETSNQENAQIRWNFIKKIYPEMENLYKGTLSTEMLRPLFGEHFDAAIDYLQKEIKEEQKRESKALPKGVWQIIDFTKKNALEEYKKSIQEARKKCEQFICIGGIGASVAHIAFNDAIEELNDPSLPTIKEKTRAFQETSCREVTLDEGTRIANARLFPSIEDVPQKAFTIGMKEIIDIPDHIILIIKGEKKRQSLESTLFAPLSAFYPSALLRQSEKTITILSDKEACPSGDKGLYTNWEYLSEERRFPVLSFPPKITMVGLEEYPWVESILKNQKTQNPSLWRKDLLVVSSNVPSNHSVFQKMPSNKTIVWEYHSLNHWKANANVVLSFKDEEERDCFQRAVQEYKGENARTNYEEIIMKEKENLGELLLLFKRREGQNIPIAPVSRQSMAFWKKTDSLNIMSPHPDDSVFGIGLLAKRILLQTQENENPVRVYNVGRSNGSHRQGRVCEDRSEEDICAWKILNLEKKYLEYLELDKKLLSAKDHKTMQLLSTTIKERVRETQGLCYIALPDPNDAHPTHRFLTAAVLDIYDNGLEESEQNKIIFIYYITPWTGTPSACVLNYSKDIATDEISRDVHPAVAGEILRGFGESSYEELENFQLKNNLYGVILFQTHSSIQEFQKDRQQRRRACSITSNFTEKDVSICA